MRNSNPTDSEVRNPRFPQLIEEGSKVSQQIRGFLHRYFFSGGSAHVQGQTGRIGQILAQMLKEGGPERPAAEGRLDEKIGHSHGTEFGEKIRIMDDRGHGIPPRPLLIECFESGNDAPDPYSPHPGFPQDPLCQLGRCFLLVLVVLVVSAARELTGVMEKRSDCRDKGIDLFQFSQLLADRGDLDRVFPEKAFLPSGLFIEGPFRLFDGFFDFFGESGKPGVDQFPETLFGYLHVLSLAIILRHQVPRQLEGGARFTVPGLFEVQGILIIMETWRRGPRQNVGRRRSSSWPGGAAVA